MKAYSKPTIEVVTIASSAPIATKSCTGPVTKDNYDCIRQYEDNLTGTHCGNYIWTNGSN